MSLTRMVPAAVPSLFHSSRSSTLCIAFAAKNSMPLTLVRPHGYWLGVPPPTALTRVVPLAVPSLFQSSPPWGESILTKNKTPLTLVMLPTPQLMKRVVPASVPSLLHSPDLVLRNSVPFTAVKPPG